MRFAVIVFSLVLLFAQTYAHAILFVPAVSGALLRTSAGQFIKVASKKAFAGAVIGASAKVVNDYCKKNSSKCKDILGDVAEYFFEDDDDTVKGCLGVIYFIGSNNNKSTNLDDIVPAEIDKAINDARKYYPTTQYVSHSQDFSDLIAQAQRNIDERAKRQVKSTTKDIYNYRKQQFIDTTVTIANSTINRKVGYSIAVKADYLCDDDIPDDKKQEIKTEKEQVKKEQAQKVVQNLSDDDITYIINNYGDEIDVDRYCSENSCDELSQEFGNEVNNNKHKYNIDKINKANCVVKNGKIVSCDNAKIEQDEEESTEEETTNEEENTTKEEDELIECDTSGLTKKICDFVGWSKSSDYDDEDDKLDIKKHDVDEPDSKVNFTGRCPAPYEVDINLEFGFMGSINYDFVLLDTPKLCEFLDDWVEPIVYFLGPLHALYILGGKRDEV